MRYTHVFWLNKLNMLVLTLAFVGLGSHFARAEEIKVGVVDMQKALQTVEDGKKAKSKLEMEFKAKKTELEEEEASIRKKGEEFQKQSLVMNEDARAKEQGKLQKRIMQLEEHKAKAQTELQQLEHELTQPILKRLKTIIGELAKQRGLTFVLEKNENMVLFSQEKDDLTTEVMASYGKQSKSGS